jgi:RimJ/RimL family protein N-acetyltransferase
MLIREVHDEDLEAFFQHQLDPDALAMAAFPARDRDAFMAHWARSRADPTVVLRTIVVDGEVAGNVVSWQEAAGWRLVGYWVGREFWGRGIATAALALFLNQVRERPLHAYVATSNVGSIRVLEKCGFRRIPVDAQAPASNARDGIEEAVLVLETP